MINEERRRGQIPLFVFAASTTKKRRYLDEQIFESWSRTFQVRRSDQIQPLSCCSTSEFLSFQYSVRGRHKWTIDDFTRRATSTEVGDSITSPIFAVEVKENHEILVRQSAFLTRPSECLNENESFQVLNFQLEVFPNGEEGEDNSDYVAVFLTSKRQVPTKPIEKYCIVLSQRITYSSFSTLTSFRPSWTSSTTFQCSNQTEHFSVELETL